MFLKRRLVSFPLIVSVFFVKFDTGKGSGSDWEGDLQQESTNFPDTFDFIIVGSGTAGCVLANRLSENGRHSVLVLEAGGVPPDIMNIPAFANEINQDTELNFQYYTTKQDFPALGSANQGTTYRIPLGRVLGGTSQINHMIINRGSPFDFDNWANMTNDQSWSYESMLPYMKRSETYLGQFPNPAQHGYNGPIYVSHQRFAPGAEKWLEAGKELGYKIRDPNGPQMISFTPIEFSKHRGRRWSSYAGYLRPVMGKRDNLKVIINAVVTRVLFEGNTAVGVEYNLNSTRGQSSNQMIVARATKEVIISAGTYNSPPLLMRSGIGPKKVLRQARIPILKDLPVGKNLQLHPRLMLQIVVTNKSLSYKPDEALNPQAYETFQRNGDGPYSSTSGYAGQAFIASSVAQTDDQNPEWADINIFLNSAEEPLQPYENITLSPDETSVNVMIYVARSKSRGTVKLDPANINGQPIIDYNAMSDPRDVQIMMDGIMKVLEIFESTKTYREQGARLLGYPVHECRQHRFKSKEYWKCYIAQVMVPGDHPVGTCSMQEVVDTELRVRGMKNLRVVDASTFKTITNSNLQAVVYATTEKISEYILRDWKE